MAAIDAYKHKLLGFIECPSTNGFVSFNEETRNIAIYQLLENIPIDEKYFDGKIGDIIVGGGRGEAPAFRISHPMAFQFFTLGDEAFSELQFETLDIIFKSFWTPTQSYIICEGFLKLGWTVDQEIELWLAENICSILVENVKDFEVYKTNKLSLKTNLTFQFPNNNLLKTTK